LARFLFITLVVFLLAPALICWWIAQQSLPVLDGVITESDLFRLVTVKFDERAVPYIEASSDSDAYFVQGYITASQRMFQMDMLRRTAEGKMSEVFGGSCVAHDKLMRTIGIERLAAANIKKMPTDIKTCLQAYARGVNAYLSSHEKKLPLPFFLLAYKPAAWREADSLSILKYGQYQADESWPLDDLRQRIFEKLGNAVSPQLFGAPISPSDKAMSVSGHVSGHVPGLEHVLEGQPKLAARRFNIEQANLPARNINPALPIWGSNAWAVASNLSETKGALLACDKHTLFTSPDTWYLCSLLGGKLHVSGATIPGVPGVLIGRNDHVAWASTALRVDSQDLLLEQFSPQFPNKYKVPSGWQSVSEIEEDIPVRFANAIVHKVLLSAEGPLLSRSEDQGSGIVLSWAGAEEKVTVFETIWRLNHADSLQSLGEAVRNYSGSPQTFVFADGKGNVGFHLGGLVPLHNEQPKTGLPALGSWGTVPVQGSTTVQNWPSRISYDQLPGSQTNNQFVIGDPPFALSTSSPYRWQRANALLAAGLRADQKVGLPDLAAMQTDQMSALAPLVKKELQAAAAKNSAVGNASAMDALQHWDGVLRPDSVPASIYEAFLHTLARRLLEPKLGQSMMLEYLERWPRWTSFVEQVLIHKPKEWLPSEERTYDTFMITTFAEAIKNIRLAAGSEKMADWTWRNCHRLSFSNELADRVAFAKPVVNYLFGVRTLGMGSDTDCIDAKNVIDSQKPWSFACNTGPTARILIDMSDKDKYYANLVLGESENPLSAYRKDQLEQWLKAEPHAVPFSREQSDKQLQHKLILSNQ
jgi:penicillin amidase